MIRLHCKPMCIPQVPTLHCGDRAQFHAGDRVRFDEHTASVVRVEDGAVLVQQPAGFANAPPFAVHFLLPRTNFRCAHAALEAPRCRELAALEEGLPSAEAGNIQVDPEAPARGVRGGLLRETGSSGLPGPQDGATFSKRPLYLRYR